ncbi:MAG: DUF2834 domain-containing protein [Parvibaculaceae bacterium]|nr:DUF2834 domain-containing protein [Parvibaculaceae bacterium]
MLNIRLLAILILIPFTVLSVYALWDVGYIGIWDYQRHSSAGWQVIVDLIIAIALILVWLVPDARKEGKNPWPWVLLTLVTGSFGPLIYLIFRKGSAEES